MAVPAALAVAGAVVALVFDSDAGRAVAFALFGIACVVAVSLVFLAVGRSEDEAREAEQRPPEPPPPPEEHPAAKRRRPRPPRRPS